MLGHLTLHEHRCCVGVKADREQHGGEPERVIADHLGLGGDGQRVKVDDAVEGVALVLADHPVPEGAEVVAQMDVTGGLNAG
ncbi:unannotated protein [freshwater metagenome]|uniref:Unannotated protein n=1 Tax=freshwater metagenome TaxID=449393 RepID=A0A6J7UT31_9ZZZZ